MFCFGSSRKVGFFSVISDVLLGDTTGKRIPVSSIFVWLTVSSRQKESNYWSAILFRKIKIHQKGILIAKLPKFEPLNRDAVILPL